MNSLDPHTLFSIFEQGDEEIYREYGLEDTLKNPFVLIGMILKGLENYTLMDIMYLRHYGQAYKKIKPTIKYKYYCKLYSYLSRIEQNRGGTTYRIGESFESASVISALNTLLVYFELIEEYEKCAVIKKYVDFVEEGAIHPQLTLI